MQHDRRISDEEEEEEVEKDEEDEEEKEDEDGSEESNVGQDKDEEGEENNNDEDKLASQSDVLPLKLKPEKHRKLDLNIPATDREVTQQSPSAHQSLLDIGGMQSELQKPTPL
jgi:hypothetical protein